MTTTYKILGQSQPSAGVETKLYISPFDSEALVRSINIVNTGSSIDHVNIAIATDTTPIYIIPAIDASQYLLYFNISTDMISWQTNLAYASGDLQFITGTNVKVVKHSSGYYYAGAIQNGYVREIITSTDLVTWTKSASFSMFGPPSSNSNIYVFNDTIYVPTNYSGYYSSTDGLSWTNHYFSYFSCEEIKFLNGLYLWYGYSYDAQRYKIYYSTDLINWTDSGFSYGQYIYSVDYGNTAYGNAYFVLISGVYTAWSTDLTNWNYSWQGITYAREIRFFKGLWLMSQYNSSFYYYSTDAFNWTIGTIDPTGPRITGNMTFFDNKIYFMPDWQPGFQSQEYYYYISTDGLSWQNNPMPNIKYNDNVNLVFGFSALDIPTSTQNKDYIVYNLSLSPSQTLTLKNGYTLGPNNSIRVKSSTGNSTITAFGSEIS